MQSAIFSGQVKHSRSQPFGHSFEYRVYMMYLDLAELDDVFAGRWFWSTKRIALARFSRKNYFGDPAVPLTRSIRDLVQRRLGFRPKGPVRLLTNLSCFGYCFNPISIYYCFDERDEKPEAIVAEVSNTPWGERHCYVLQPGQQDAHAGVQRAEGQKKLHVSPFIGMDVHYDWLFTRPEDDLVVRIRNRTNNEVFFLATLILRRTEISTASLAATLLRFPLMTFKVAIGIYWQALRLWARGCPVHAHPEKHSSMQVSR